MGALRRRAWEIVEAAQAGDRTSRTFDILILGLITLNVLAVILGSVRAIETAYGGLLDAFELFSTAVFSVEYLVRLWSCTADARFTGWMRGRLRFALTPLALVDLVAVLPFYVAFIGADLRFVRVLRLFRIVRVAKLGRYTSALDLMGRVVNGRKAELVLATAVMAVLLVLASALMWQLEYDAQPDAFPDIPSTMWWAVATLTTVGYGDVTPVTPVGKILASLVAVLGIGLFALPTSILGSGFVDEIQKRRKPRTCPHCGKSID